MIPKEEFKQLASILAAKVENIQPPYDPVSFKQGFYEGMVKAFEIFEFSKPCNCFIPLNDTTSATICSNCGKEKFLHSIY